jgi:hypothetical protein
MTVSACPAVRSTWRCERVRVPIARAVRS